MSTIARILKKPLQSNKSCSERVRRGRGLGILNEIKCKMEAASGFEPLQRAKVCRVDLPAPVSLYLLPLYFLFLFR